MSLFTVQKAISQSPDSNNPTGPGDTSISDRDVDIIARAYVSDLAASLSYGGGVVDVAVAFVGVAC
jgi:hypothetical protein